MADSAQDKRLPATGRKIEKARKEGQVARSRDLGHFVAFAAGGALIVALARPLTDWLVSLLGQGLRFDRAAVTDPAAMTQLMADLGGQMLAVVVTLGLVLAAVAVAASVLSGGWNFTLKPLRPKFEKLNPMNGLGRLFSKQQLVPTLKACGLALVLFGVTAWHLQGHREDYVLLLARPLPAALAGAGAILLDGLLLAVGVLALFSLVDVPLQRWLLAENLKMSHQDVKQEHKEVEGNAEVKSKMKTLMRQRSRKRMLGAVPQADIVVMNPTHFAVALRYDEGGSGAPRVVAKGSDRLALKIREIAIDAKVPVLQAPPLARALFTHCEVDQEIPGPLFATVAQVLAWVYQLRAALAAGLPLPDAPGALSVPPEFDPLNKSRPGAEP